MVMQIPFLIFWTGFVLFFTLSIYLSLKILEKMEFKNVLSDKIFVLFFLAFIVVAVMIFTFALYDFHEDSDSQSYMHSLYVLEFIPVVIIGFFIDYLLLSILKKEKFNKTSQDKKIYTIH